MATNNPAGPNYTPAPTPTLQSSAGSQGPMYPGSTPATQQAAAASPPATPTTAPAPVPAAPFMTPAMQTYVNQFRSSQAQQQQALNGALVQALQGLGERRDSAAKVAATLPGAYEQQYQEATANQHLADQQAGQGLPGAGAKGVAQANPVVAGAVKGDQALLATSNKDQAAIGKESQPLLSAAITADTTKGQNTLANTNLSNEAALSQQQQAFDQQMSLAQASYQQQAAMQQAGYAHDTQMAQLNSTLGVNAYKQENPNAALSPAQQEQLQNQSALDQKAITAGFSNNAQLQQTEALPAYQQLVGVLTGQQGLQVTEPNGQQVEVKPGDRSILKYITDQNLLKALIANGYAGPPSATNPYGV